jgi:hypothetical protein
MEKEGCGRTLRSILFPRKFAFSHWRGDYDANVRKRDNCDNLDTVWPTSARRCGNVLRPRCQTGLGDSTTIPKTVYVPGKQQQIETSHDEKIIDLEKGVLYEIDPNRKS